MKLIKTSVATVALATLLAGSLSTYAQTSTNGAARQGMRGVEGQMTRLSEDLKLTADQKPKVKALLEEQNKKRQELRAEGTPDRTKMQALQEETTKKMKEVLTAEQFTKYEEFIKTQRNRRQGAGGGASADKSGVAPKAKKNADK